MDRDFVHDVGLLSQLLLGRARFTSQEVHSNNKVIPRILITHWYANTKSVGAAEAVSTVSGWRGFIFPVATKSLLDLVSFPADWLRT